ncbi:MAG: D-allose transport system permease protein AlsC [Spirochaetes bacterium ADurb.Bin001]|nr:MAG: D-allose transport system permease protein AlsC [Spirochaetes bacterium ADurb.Bin001]
MTQIAVNHKNLSAETIGKNWITLFLVILVIVFSLIAPAFFSIDTLQLILFNGTEVFLLGAAELFVIITGGIDLSVGFVMGFSTIMSSKLIVIFQGFGLPPFMSILSGSLIMLVIGLLPGLVNGWLVAYLRVPAFIATFSMLGITHGISELMTQGVPTKNLPSLAGIIGNGSFLYISPDRKIHFFTRPQVARGQIVVSILPNMVVFAFIFILIFSFLLSKTKFGRHLYAIGGNIDAAIRSGINVKKDLLKAYMISSFFASLAGISYVMKYITGKPDAGADLLLDSIAAVVIGGASMAGGSGTMGRTILGALVIAVVQTGLRIIGMQTFMTYILVGSILIIAVILDQVFPNLNR